MAAGIVVRGIASLLQDKTTDPCVLVADQRGEHVISLLSGHLGGGNRLTLEVAALLGARPVITTASDILGLTPLDVWARGLDLTANSRESLTRASAILVNNGVLRLYSEVALKSLPPDVLVAENASVADVIISNRTCWRCDSLVLHPRNLVVGIGCNRGTAAAEMADALEQFLAAGSYALSSVRNLASIDLKQDEAGLLEFAGSNNWKIDFFTKEALNGVSGISTSAAVLQAVGAKGVAEPAALLSAERDSLLLEKKKWPNVTLALAEANCMLSAQVLEA
jgi:cobalt-precorrin 5A hydrolase